MAAQRKIRNGSTVRLIEPLAEFRCIEPNPVPVGTTGTVRHTCEDGGLRVAWDTGYTSGVHRRAIEIVKGRR